MIVTLVMLGEVLQLRAIGQTSQAIQQAAARWRPIPQGGSRQDGREEEVPLESVQVGDGCGSRPGEKVPVDGSVLEGASTWTNR